MSERDPFAPIIGGFDCSGITDPFSLRCEPFFVDGENGGTLLDGSTVHDVLASQVRFSWRLNVMTPAQYAALSAATLGAESLDTVSAYVYDSTVDAVRLARFHVTRPSCHTIRNMGQIWNIPQSELVLEEAAPIARFAVTPPTKTAYDVGDALDLTGLSVTRYDPDGAASDITAECTFDPAAGSVLLTAGAVALTVSYDNTPLAAYLLTVTLPHGDWWTLRENGTLEIYCRGNMPPSPYQWQKYKAQITSVTIANSVTSIGSIAFYNCNRIASVTIPNSVDIIGNYAFRGCSLLASVTIPSGVTSIGKGAFEECDSLTSVTIPNSVTSIGAGAFWGSRLRSVTIPSHVTRIEDDTFRQTHLASVTIPSGVTSIGEGAFWGCSLLRSITIPDSVTSIGNNAFDCEYLTDVYYGGSQAQWGAISIGGGNGDLTRATIHYNSAGPEPEPEPIPPQM